MKTSRPHSVAGFLQNMIDSKQEDQKSDDENRTENRHSITDFLCFILKNEREQAYKSNSHKAAHCIAQQVGDIAGSDCQHKLKCLI